MGVDSGLWSGDGKLTAYVSTGCNRTPHCVDWGGNGYICFGACNAVALAQFSDGCCRVLATVARHKGRVNSVRWIRGVACHSETELVSCSSDNTVVVWRLDGAEIQPIAVMTSHTGSVSTGEGLYCGEPSGQNYPDTYIASAAADSSVKLWLRKQGREEFACVWSVELSSGLCLCVCLTVVPDTGSVVLACGTDDGNVHLYCDKERLQTLLGHEDWVRCLHFTLTGKDVMLASGSQDTTIRLWRLSRRADPDRADRDLRLDEQVCRLQGEQYVVALEALLSGHEAWVSHLQWKPGSEGRQLVSCSLDRTVLLWEVDPVSGVWLETCRLGELGGNTLGYLSVAFSPHSLHLLANSHQGALHMWTSQRDGTWRSVGCVGGHSDGVVGVAWELPRGRFLVSCSLDKTTRLHAPFSTLSYTQSCWYEMSRPQVHGHAMSGVVCLPGMTLASVSEEKVVRVFTAPDNVLRSLTNLTLTFTDGDRGRQSAVGAEVPSLGLSNRAVLPAEQLQSTPHLTEPPTEDYLAQNTLWPEVMKLYGHGFEVFTLAASHRGDLLASACKASSALHAAIILWDTETWDQICQLEGHSLTVTQMQFSPDDSKLLSVSRDRTWCLYLRQGDSKELKLVMRSEKGLNPHSRIIWTCGWTWDGVYFGTGSRDCRAVVWPGDSLHVGARPPACVPLLCPQGVTALAFSPSPPPCLPPLHYLLALGLDSGLVQVYLWHPTAWTLLCTVPPHLGHHLTVNRLVFRPAHGRAEQPPQQADHDTVQLASCSSDHSVRVFTINLPHYVNNIKQIKQS